MTSEEAIKLIDTHTVCFYNEIDSPTLQALHLAIEALSAEPTCKNCTDLISRADAIEAVEYNSYGMGSRASVKAIKALPSADAVQGWRIGKPTEQGKYMVTIDTFGHKHIDLFYYGKPMMPHRKVRGKCWYRSDDEWGDIVYDDTDILAWQPLPKPYKGGDDE